MRCGAGRLAGEYTARTMADEALAEEWTQELFNKIYQAYNGQDVAATADCYAPDLLVTVNGEQGPKDRDAFIEALEEQWRGFPDVVATELSRLVVGRRVVTEMEIDGHNSGSFLGRAATSKRWHVKLAWICTVEDGRVGELRVYVDNQALRQAVSSR